MSWIDRLQQAAYTPPSGTRLTFAYEDVSVEVDKRTAAFEFPDADGTLVQDNGVGGRRYPLRVYFSGPDCDTDADTFLAALTESGAGKLEHPIYGTQTVVPFGKIKRLDALKTGGNQAAIETTFWSTIGATYPTGQTDAYSEVVAAVDAFNDAAGSEFEELASLDTSVEQAVLKGRYQQLLDAAKTGLEDIANTDPDVASYFFEVYDSIDASLATLIATPVTLASQTAQLIQSAALSATGYASTFAAYASLVDDIITGDSASYTAGYDSSASNEFHAADLFASNDVAASVTAAVNKTFTTKAGALEAAEGLLDALDDVRTWREDNFVSLGEVDTGAGYQALQNAVALAAGFLVELSFTLRQERVVTLDRARTIIDLAAEYYGEVDTVLDFIIDSNGLSGSEILEMPKGREFVYYV